MDRTVAISCTVAVLFVFTAMIVSYGKKRANRRYAMGKLRAPSVRYFKHLSKLLFFLNMLVTLFGYWFKMAGSFHHNNALKIVGALMVLVGYFCLRKSFAELANNYSPMFDAYVPLTIHTQGVYALIRHPIYAFNLLVSLGLTLSSGSAVVLINSVIGWLFVLRAIYLEEMYLPEKFPEYSEYAKRTWKLIPYLY